MRSAGGLLLTLALVALIAVRVASPRSLGAAFEETRVLVVSDQARRYLALQFRAYSTEFMGCMIGDVRAGLVRVQRIAPADVEPTQSTPTRVMPKRTCEAAGWQGTVGMIHSHPGGERCFYFFPGTRVLTSDGQSFARQAYPVDAIMCGDGIVWVNRALVQRELLLADRRWSPTGEPAVGNRVHDGSLGDK